MLIKGIQKTTLLDYPGKIASIIFLAGCNFRCPYCQNPSLVNGYEELPTIPEGEVIEFLRSRLKWLDGVCITGGEPTLHRDLPGFISKVKKEGLLVKLDTNGSNPGMLEGLLGEGLLDYIAMDIKAPIHRYAEVVKAEVDLNKIQKSVEMIRGSGLDYEFRTTVVPGLLGEEDIAGITNWLKGSKKYYLQQFRNHDTLDNAFREVPPYTPEELHSLAAIASKGFETCEVRGV
jgi:pyruvate formate lyase activating enzyme